MKVLIGSGGGTIGHKIIDFFGSCVIKAKITKFQDGEARVEIKESISPKERIFIIQSTNSDSNIIELLFIIDALKRLGATDIVPVIPYFGYARSDRIVQYGSPIGAKVIANAINSDISALIVLDIHFSQFEAFFDVPVYNLLPDKIFAEYINCNLFYNNVVVAPDLGSAKKSRTFAQMLGLDVIVINKHRLSVGVSEVIDIIGDPNGKNCIILDDIVCGGGTLCGAAQRLSKLGANSIRAFVTHYVPIDETYSRIDASVIDEVLVTDSTAAKVYGNKIKVVTAASIIAEKIKSIS